MPDTNTPLTRQQLFRLVWNKPVTHIAMEFGVQPAVVLKACRILNIPRPTTGHWVKVEYGQIPASPALVPLAPGTQESTTLGELMSRRRRNPKAEPPAVTPVAPEIESTKWHTAVQKTKSALRGGPVDQKYGTIHPKPEHDHLMVSVTHPSMDRVLLLLNQLAWLLEGQGFTFQMPDKGNTQIKLVYAATGTELAFIIKEDVERYERDLRPDEKNKDRFYLWDRWRHRPTGKLRLIINEYHPEGVQKSWGDGKNTKLEDKLADAAPGFVVCAQGKHAHHLEWQARQRLWEEEARIRREEEARAQKEKERREALLGAAKSWRKAKGLQAFRVACEAKLRSNSPDGTLTQLQAGWLEWVDGVIRDTNPLTAGFL
jgi:hypothetical protein